MSTQPTWKLLANLGDASPLEYGGFFVYTDETGQYAPEAELLQEPEDGIDVDSKRARWTVYRFSLDRCTLTHVEDEQGDYEVLSDNAFHPLHPAWFAGTTREQRERPQDTTYLAGVASCIGVSVDDLHKWFCSDDPLERAEAYRAIGDYHGYENLDSYPLTLTKAEVEDRYKGEL